MSTLQIYSASAGSGKTFALTLEYLKLAFRSAGNFAKILAVTFTNKAAQEMKERILKELNNIAKNGDKAPLFVDIQAIYPNINIQNEAQLILDKVLHNYSNFSVSTIDSFVQKVIRAFSFEIGVQSAYKIEMDNDKVLSELTEILYQRLDNEENLLNWFVKFAFYKIDEGKSWDFREEVQKLAKEIFKEEFQNFADEAVIHLKDKNFLQSFFSKLTQTQTQFRTFFQENAKTVESVLQKAGMENGNYGKNFGVILNYLTNKTVNPKSIADYEPGKTVLAALDSVENWYAKSAKSDVRNAVEMVYQPLSECLENAVNFYNNNFSDYLSARNTIINFHSFGILSDIASLLPSYREDNNLLLISDTTLLLKKIIADNDTPFIYEKVGNQYNHILIDEFQDTSGFQWENFKPLIKNTLANGFFNLIVGDIKQSIYRWRGGDWKLLLNTVKQDIGSNMITNSVLETNWRSRQNVVDFNNALFHYAPQILQLDYNSELENISDSNVKRSLKDLNYHNTLVSAYYDSFQKLPENVEKKGGRVRIEFVKCERKDFRKKWRENIETVYPQVIDNLLKDKNYEPRDIAILVRTNKQGKTVVEQLLDYMQTNAEALHYDILSAESLFINNSSSVRLLISAFTFLMNRNEELHLVNLIKECALLQDNFWSNEHKIFDIQDKKENLENFLPKEFIENRKHLKRLPLYELSEELIRIFDLNKPQNISQFAYIQTLQDAILSFSKNEGAGLIAFLEWWQKEGHKISLQISEKQNAVKVMTIHQSKGLAFKVVILPFVDWRIDHDAMISPIVWCKTEKEPYNSFSYLPIKYKSELANTVFCKNYFEEKLYAAMDALNTLYVAFTRSENELIAFAPTDEKLDKLDSVADLLLQTVVAAHNNKLHNNNEIKALMPFFDREKLRLEIDLNYKNKDTHKFIKENRDVNTFELSKYPNHEWRKKITIKRNASDYFIERDENRTERINYGKLMHRILSSIKTLHDLETVLQDMFFAGEVGILERMLLKAKIVDIVSNDKVKHWFSDEWTVINETEILSAKGEKRIPDRILLGYSELLIIDFKFGKHREEHLVQMKNYIELMKTMDEAKNKSITGFLYYAEEKEIMKVL